MGNKVSVLIPSRNDGGPEMSIASVILLSWLWVPLLLLGGLVGFVSAAFMDGVRQGRYYGRKEFWRGGKLEQLNGE